MAALPQAIIPDPIRFHRDAIEAQVTMVNELAEGIDGELVVATFGEDPQRTNPKTGRLGLPIHKQIARFSPGQVTPMVDAIMSWEGVEHANVYVPLHVVRRGLGHNERGSKKDIVAILGLAADMDADKGLAGSMPISPSLELETSAGNRQAFFVFDCPLVPAEASSIAAALLAATGGDAGTKDIDHVWRVAGTLNWPNAAKVARGRPFAPQLITVKKAWDGTLIRAADLTAALAARVSIPDINPANASLQSVPVSIASIVDRLPDWLREKLAKPRGEQSRSEHIYNVVGDLKQYVTPYEAFEIIEAHPKGVGEKFADRNDLAAEVLRAWSRTGQQPQRNSNSAVIYAGIDRPFTPEAELIRDTFPETGVAFNGGQSGALKTFFGVHFSTCVMTRTPLAGRKIERQGGVVYIAAEGEATIEGRLKAARSRLQTPTAPLPFFQIRGICPLAGEAAFAELEERLREAHQESLTRHGLPVVACIIDTVIAAGMIAEDKENDPVAWQRGVFDPLQKISKDLRLLFLLTHHFGKSPAAGLRGSSNSRAGADAILALTCDRDELTGKTSNHFLALSKSRSAPEGPIGSISYEQVQIGQRLDGSPVTSLVLNINTGNKSRFTRKESRAERAFREALVAALKGAGVRVKVHGHDDGREVTAVPVCDVRGQFEKRYVTTGEDDRKRRDLIRKQFKIAIDRAVAGQTVCAGTWDGTEWLWQ